MDKEQPYEEKRSRPLNFSISLVVAMVLSVVTLFISDTDFRLDESSIEPILTFPPDNPDDLQLWFARSQKENTEITADGLTVWSKKPQQGAITTRIPLDVDKLGKNAFVSVKATVVNSDKPFGDETQNKFGKRPSMVIVRPSTEDRVESLRDFLYKPLNMSEKTQYWHAVARVDERTTTLNAHMLLRSPGAWTLEALDVSSVSLSLRYLFALSGTILCWFLLFGLIVRRLFEGRHWSLQVLGLIGVIGVGLGASFSRKVLRLLNEQVTNLTHYVSIDASAHMLGHVIVSIGALVYMGLSIRSVTNVLILNLMVAMFVETLQAHLPHRNSSIEDIGYGMVGALAATVLAMMFWFVKIIYARLFNRQQTAVDDDYSGR